jgi:hypothetical protein
MPLQVALSGKKRRAIRLNINRNPLNRSTKGAHAVAVQVRGVLHARAVAPATRLVLLRLP